MPARSLPVEIGPLYPLRSGGYNFEKVVERVAELLAMDLQQVVTASKSRNAVKARSMVFR